MNNELQVSGQPSQTAPIDWDAAAATAASLLSRYLQFDTSNPPGNEAPAIEFLAGVLRRHNLDPQIVCAAPNRANLIVRLPARQYPAQRPCLLYAHADVVPADAADWSVPPFGGHIQDGYVWGRGALDNKGLGIIFLQALILLKQHAPALNRDIILLIAADEEASGRHGAAWLLQHHPHLIEAEYVWDEGGVGRRQAGRNVYHIAVAEKIALTIKLTAHGAPGHASMPQRNTAHDRLVRALYRLKQWQMPARLTQTTFNMLQALAPYQPFPRSFLFANANRPLLWPLLRPRLQNDRLFAPLISNTLNLTVLRGGQASNVISARAEALLDARLLPDEDPQAFLAALRSIIGDASVAVHVDTLPARQQPTPTDAPFYRALARTLHSIDPTGQVLPYLTPGATDSRFFRAAGMKAYGFMPLLLNDNELGRIHGIDERVSVDNLGWGIRLVFETLKNFCA